MSQDHKKGQLAFRSLKDDKRNVPSPKKKGSQFLKVLKFALSKGKFNSQLTNSRD